MKKILNDEIRDAELQFQQITRSAKTKELATTITSKTFIMEYDKCMYGCAFSRRRNKNVTVRVLLS